MLDKSRFVQEFYNRVWVDGAVGEIGHFLDLDAGANGLIPDLAINTAEFPEFVAMLKEMLDVRRVTFEKTVECGEWIAVMATFEATVLATGLTIGGSGMLMARIVDSKIVEAYNCFDFLGLFEKIGLLPENTLALCMTGQRLS